MISIICGASAFTPTGLQPVLLAEGFRLLHDFTGRGVNGDRLLLLCSGNQFLQIERFSLRTVLLSRAAISTAANCASWWFLKSQWELIRGKIVTQPVAVEKVQGGSELTVHLLARLPARP
jgi:hypothetical protein